jgi:hypothetical protein
VGFTAEGAEKIYDSGVGSLISQRSTGEIKYKKISAYSAFSAVQAFALPQPPPPGDSIRTPSPERSRTLVLPGISSEEPSRRMIEVRPALPSAPPAKP